MILLANRIIVTEDLVRYMESAMSPSNRFLVDDPVWAIDFAPNGQSYTK
jgi:gamma-glutamyltranspeptidase/glutathione hydrolase